MWELMRAHRCEFLSLREQFDTTSAAGEMVMYTIANIAQFERRQTSERIAANFHARAQRGLFNGGSVPLGYKMDPERKGYLIIVEEEAAIVRDLFKTFLEQGVVSLAGKKLNSKGYAIPKKRAAGGNNPRVGYFTVGNVQRLLTNTAFIGVRTFKVNGVEQTSKACWEPIIDEETFNKVQENGDGDSDNEDEEQEEDDEAEGADVSGADSNTKRFYVTTGHITPLSLYQWIFLTNSENAVLVLDDSDSVLTNETTLGILKGAVDDKEHRYVSYRSNAKAAGNFPSSVEVLSKIIVITNRSLEAGDAKNPHQEAFLNRIVHVDVSLTLKQRFDFVAEKIVPRDFMGSTLEQRRKCFELVKERAVLSPEKFSLRTFEKMLPFFLENPERFSRRLDREFPRDSDSAVMIDCIRRHKLTTDAIRKYASIKGCNEKTAWNHKKKFEQLIKMSMDAL
jgi:hypothetical protein